MIINGVRTIYNVKLVNSKLFNKPYIVTPGTTLNEKFNVLRDYEFTDEIKPVINHMVIGSSITNIENTRSPLDTLLSKHSSVDAALFNHIPFYAHDIKEPLEDIANDCVLKTNMFIDGNNYETYYGYKLNNTFISPYIIEQIINDATKVSTLKEFNPSEYNVLKPVPSTDTITSTNTYVRDDVTIPFYIGQDLLNSVKRSMKLLNPDIDKYLITEIGLCSGVIVPIENREEVLFSQINYILDTYIDITNLDYLDYKMSIGGLELLKK